MKWYDSPEIDKSTVLTSRLRLARNLSKYPFSIKINPEQAAHMIDDVKNAIINDRVPIANMFSVYNLATVSKLDKNCMVEKHMISHALAVKEQAGGLIQRNDEQASIMLNEEDHIRIQTIIHGDNIDRAWEEANLIDNLLEESLDYAFDDELGYLTACPTNVGTGIRASFMLHLPVLEFTGQLKHIVPVISKFGLTVRGTYGEGSEAFGGIYQISNQLTLGKSENEIITSLKNVVNQIITKEEALRGKILFENRLDIEDRIYRAYGILSTARKISVKEAMIHLSYLRFGVLLGLINLNIKSTIYNLMMNIQSANVQKRMGGQSDNQDQMDVERASYLRNELCANQ